MSIAKVILAEKFALFTTHWDPKIVGALNGQHVKLVKFRGRFVWHQHDAEDELFLVVRGSFTMRFRDRAVDLMNALSGASLNEGAREAIRQAAIAVLPSEARYY